MVPFRIQFLISSILGFIKTIESMIKPVSSHSLFISNDQLIILRQFKMNFDSYVNI